MTHGSAFSPDVKITTVMSLKGQKSLIWKERDFLSNVTRRELASEVHGFYFGFCFHPLKINACLHIDVDIFSIS